MKARLLAAIAEANWVYKRTRVAEADTDHHETANERVPGTALIGVTQQANG